MNRMGADIVERLRANSPEMPTSDRFEAADEIERLRAAIAKAPANCGSCETVLSELIAHIQGVLDGDYKLDDATLRPARELLAGRPPADMEELRAEIARYAAQVCDMDKEMDRYANENRYLRGVLAALTASPHVPPADMEKAVEAAASVVRKRAGCFGRPAIAECTDMSPGGNCDCAEFAREIVAAASPHAPADMEKLRGQIVEALVFASPSRLPLPRQ